MLFMRGPLKMTKNLSHISCVDPQFNFWSLKPYELMVYSLCPLSWFIPRLIPPMTRLMWHTSLITHDLACIPHHPHSLVQSFFDLENVSHSIGIFRRVCHVYHSSTPSHDFTDWYLNPCFQCQNSVEMLSKDLAFMILGNSFWIWKAQQWCTA